MKRSLLPLLFVIGLISLTSCKKEQTTGLEFTATMEECTDVRNGKTVLNGEYLHWTTDDQVRIYGNGWSDFAVTPLSPATNARFTAIEGGSLEQSSTYRAYYPSTLTTDGVTITLPTTQTSVDGTLRDFPMYTESTTQQLAFKNLCGVLKLNLQKTGVTVTSIKLTMGSPINGTYTVSTTNGVPELSLQSGSGSNTTTLECNQSINSAHDFYIYLPEGTYSGLTLEITASDGTVCTKGPATSNVVIERSKYSTLTLGGDNLEFFDPSDWVDLGLPSGLLWATRNVGATSPEDYGDYFAWGETTTKSVYLWSTYIYCNGEIEEEDYDHLTKYCNNSSYGYNGFTDNLTILQPGDDAATANYGGRTPTKEEWQELINNTTAQWTTRNGVNGRLFTSSNGNSLFLPAAGYRWDSSLNYAGSRSFYWSSSLDTDDPSRAWNFVFISAFQGVKGGNRDDGRSVRAVRSAQ